ncbi:hypothetical protein N9484_02225 [Polaribacter sp.]|nr:hypothetical protein [Polaribacter sp.]
MDEFCVTDCSNCLSASAFCGMRVRKAGHFSLEMNAQSIIIQLKMSNFAT